VAEAVSEAMGGTSGAIAEIMLRAMVSYFTTTSSEVLEDSIKCVYEIESSH
jgi:hypothetical protein